MNKLRRHPVPGEGMFQRGGEEGGETKKGRGGAFVLSGVGPNFQRCFVFGGFILFVFTKNKKTTGRCRFRSSDLGSASIWGWGLQHGCKGQSLGNAPPLERMRFEDLCPSRRNFFGWERRLRGAVDSLPPPRFKEVLVLLGVLLPGFIGGLFLAIGEGGADP